jgi:hypothetical protein
VGSMIGRTATSVRPKGKISERRAGVAVKSHDRAFFYLHQDPMTIGQVYLETLPKVITPAFLRHFLPTRYRLPFEETAKVSFVSSAVILKYTA